MRLTSQVLKNPIKLGELTHELKPNSPVQSSLYYHSYNNNWFFSYILTYLSLITWPCGGVVSIFYIVLG